MSKLTIIVGLAFFILCHTANADDPHHHGSTVSTYNIINKYPDCTGLTAIHAANQIHPSENISGLQFGGGLAKNGNCFGGALGAAFNFKGLGLVNGSITKEGDETIWGVGFNTSIRP